jgi:hypothetical protein
MTYEQFLGVEVLVAAATGWAAGKILILDIAPVVINRVWRWGRRTA